MNFFVQESLYCILQRNVEALIVNLILMLWQYSQNPINVNNRAEGNLQL